MKDREGVVAKGALTDMCDDVFPNTFVCIIALLTTSLAPAAPMPDNPAIDMAGGRICMDGGRHPDEVFCSTSVGPCPNNGTVGVRDKLGALAAGAFGLSFRSC